MDNLTIKDCGSYFTVVNVKGEKKHHSHVKKRSTAELLCKLILKQEVPRSSYLRQSAKRITLCEKYKNEINVKIKKDKQKQGYYNKNNHNLK